MKNEPPFIFFADIVKEKDLILQRFETIASNSTGPTSVKSFDPKPSTQPRNAFSIS